MTAFNSARILSDERCAGKRAPFHVYYTKKNGKKFVDTAYTATSDEAAAFIKRNVRGATIIQVVATTGDL